MSVEFEHFIGLNPIQRAVLYHPNGQNYVYGAGANVVIGDLTDPHKQLFFRHHDDCVTALAISPSGTLIASGQRGEHSNIYVWDFETREVLYCLEEHDHMIQGLSFSHDNKILVSIGNSNDRKLICWDVSNGCIIASSGKLSAGTTSVLHGGFVRDIKRRDTPNYLMCSAGEDGFVLWSLDPYSGELECLKLSGDARAGVMRTITAIEFSDDRESVYGATTSGDYVVASIRSQRIVQTFVTTRMGVDSILEFDGRVIAGCGDCTIKYFNETSALIGQTQLDGRVVSLSFSPDRLEILAATSHGTIARVNVMSQQYITISESHTAPVIAVAFQPGNSERFATASSDGTIRVWDVAEYAVSATATAKREQEGGVRPLCLQLSDVLLSGWSDGKVLAHNSETGANLWFIDNAHAGGVTALVLSHNRRFVLTGGPTGEVRLWELRSRDLISHLKEHVHKITSLALFEDDTVAFSASRDRCILRWDLKTERRSFCHKQRMGGINGIVVAKDEQHILSVGQERKLVYWNVAAPEPAHQQWVDGSHAAGEGDGGDEGKCIAISHSGHLLATGGTSGVLRVWDFRSTAVIAELIGHSATINAVSFSPDDKQIVSVGDDGSVCVWCVF